MKLFVLVVFLWTLGWPFSVIGRETLNGAGRKVAPEVFRHGRAALVIGNGDYRNVGLLKNPVNDAADIAGALGDLGFEVILKLNADRRTMIQAMEEFYNRLSLKEAGLFFYSGHGLEVGGVNYLLPVDARIQTESDIEFEGVDAGRLLGKMEAARARVNIVILDACRNNPFARSFRSVGQGLARMDGPRGSFIAFATAPGSVAADGEGRNGVFSKHLLGHIKEENLKIEDLMKRVRLGVLRETNDRQTPWQSSSLTEDFYFVDQDRPGLRPETPATSGGGGREDIQADKWRVLHGQWSLDRDELSTQSGQVDSELIYNTPLTGAYTLEVEARPMDGPGKTALLFGSDGNTFYQLEISASDQAVFLFKSGTWELLARAGKRIGFNRWHRLKAAVSPDRVVCYVDGERLFSHTVTLREPWRAGLRTAWTRARFKNFQIRVQGTPK